MATHEQTLQSPREHGQNKIPVVEDDDDDDGRKCERVERGQWLRAAILGASDGLLSTTSLMVGIGGVRDDRWSMVLVGLAGALAGACSMAVGEFVSVSTQRDIEQIVLSSTTTAKPDDKVVINCKLDDDDDVATANSTTSDPPTPTPRNINIVETLVVNSTTAPPKGTGKLPFVSSPGTGTGMKLVMIMDDEDAKPNSASASSSINIRRQQQKILVSLPLPSPWKAAAASALAFLCGSFVPLASAMFVSHNTVRTVLIAVVASLALALLGGVAAQLGGAPITPSALRVLLGGWIAIAITYALLKPFGHRDDDHDHAQ